MTDAIPLPTKPNVEAAFEQYASLLREIQIEPGLLDDPDHAREVEQAERRWRDLFTKWAKTENLPRKRAI